MKQMLMRKTAIVLAALMTVSLLIPVLAFAAFGNITASNGTVTGTVYIDEATYQQYGSEQIKVYLYDANGNNVYNSDGTHVYVIAQYNRAKTVNGITYYDFSVASNAYSTYGALNFKYLDPGTNSIVTSGIYNRNYFVGGPIITPPPTGTVDPEITVGADGTVDAAQLAAALANDGKATVIIKGEVALLPASALVNGEEVTITTDEGVSYILPIKALDLDALAKSLGVSLNDLKIKVGIAALSGTQASDVAKAAVAAKANVRSAAIDFTLSAVGGAKEEAITNLPVYVARVLPVTGEVANPGKLVVVRYNPTTGKFQPVPTTVTTTEDGKTNVKANSRSNSIYVTIETEGKVFADLAKHWAKADVEKLSNKLIVEGTSANSFEPKRSITRAEVAALIVRALGLEASGTTDKFSDVASDKWYSGAVAAAVEAGIINGLPNGTFNPNAAITRRDLAAMVVRAQVFAGKTVELTSDEVTKALSAYTDAATLGGQKEAVAIAVNSGLVKGQTGTKIAGLANTNRAEAATLIARLLTNVGFMS